MSNAAVKQELGTEITISMGSMLSASVVSRLGRMVDMTLSMMFSLIFLAVSPPFISIVMASSLLQVASGPMKVSRRRSRFSTRAPI